MQSNDSTPSMAYTIELSPRAFADIDAIVGYIQADSPQNATHWRGKLFEKIETLRTFPRGCSLAPEDEHCPFEVRQSIFGRYRILFMVRDDNSLVYILTVRHGSRRLLPPDDVVESGRAD